MKLIEKRQLYELSKLKFENSCEKYKKNKKKKKKATSKMQLGDNLSMLNEIVMV